MGHIEFIFFVAVACVLIYILYTMQATQVVAFH